VQLAHTYQDIISVENLLAAWKEFMRGKRKKQDVQEFQYRLMDNILLLHRELKDKTYVHGGYRHFSISDPKPRDIHKASVRDRLLHHALYRTLYPFFDATFITDSYSCRVGKGTHKAMNRLRTFARKVSHNHTRTCFVLKCDIRKFFASIDQKILLGIVRGHIPDSRIVSLIAEVVGSFCVPYSSRSCELRNRQKGLPLGNLTSQLLVNIYMKEFDQFVKHTLKAKYYIRYADDFVLISHNKQWLLNLVPYMELFLREKLKLTLHQDKTFIKNFASGVDFLGWVHFQDHRVLRAVTKKRMLRRLLERKGSEGEETMQESYLGLLSHGNARKLKNRISML